MMALARGSASRAVLVIAFSPNDTQAPSLAMRVNATAA
jgi:hypothetical protein